MADKLKRCPFCGGEASIYHGDDTDGYIKGTSYVMAFCGWCGASIRGKKEDEVIKKWNNRPSPWHTGTPTEEGFFAVYYYADNEYDYGFADWNGKYWEEHFSFDSVGCRIIAWQKTEHYKED